MTPIHVLIIVARFYEELADELLRGAQAELTNNGATYDVIEAPGAFELPTALRMAVQSVRSSDLTNVRRPYDGYVVLGCTIRGETSHYDHVSEECARGLNDVSIQNALALGFGVLTVENEDQAWARAAVEEGDKGGDAARACLRMVALRRSLGLRP